MDKVVKNAPDGSLPAMLKRSTSGMSNSFRHCLPHSGSWAMWVLVVAGLLIGLQPSVVAVTIAEADGWTAALEGFVYFQWAFDDNELARATHLGWVSGSSARSKTEMSWDATRLTLALSKEEDGDLTTGLIEFDFHNDHSPRFRHAYVSHRWDSWHVLAGQTWLLIGDNGPAVNNDDWLWMQGNVHDRLAQVRISHTRNDYELSLSLNPQPSSPLLFGDFAALSPTLPWVQGRVKKALSEGGFWSLAGAAGLWQFEGTVLDTIDKDVGSWIVRGDVDLHLSKVRMIAALWGSSAGGYGSAVTQVAYLDSTLEVQPVRSWGGFINFVFPVSDVIDLGLFSGIDDPEDRPDNVPLTFRRNLTLGGNVFWHPASYLTYSLEVQFAQTDFDRGSPQEFQNLRIMGAAKFVF